MGAIATGGVLMLNDAIISLSGVSPEQIDEAVAREQVELQRREHTYRNDQPRPIYAAGT